MPLTGPPAIQRGLQCLDGLGPLAIVLADAEIRAVDAATGDQKVRAIADLVSRLVSDLKDTHHHIMEMHKDMMPAK